VRTPFGRKTLDPRYGNNLIDAHFLDALEGEEAEALERIMRFYAEERFTLLIPHSVRAEIEHENTPDHVKARARQFIFTEPVQLTAPERERVEQARALMRGNAKAGKHDSDASHIVEAAKHGGRYFITNDGRILKKKNEISALLGIKIVAPTEFLAAYEKCCQTDL